jgi:hypothetical protein
LTTSAWLERRERVPAFAASYVWTCENGMQVKTDTVRSVGYGCYNFCVRANGG